MNGIDWVDQAEARSAFFADTPDIHSWPIEDQELWHKFATSAERFELGPGAGAIDRLINRRVVVR